MPMFDLMQGCDPDPVEEELLLADDPEWTSHERPQVEALDRQAA
jgi:hypothetical protein